MVDTQENSLWDMINKTGYWGQLERWWGVGTLNNGERISTHWKNVLCMYSTAIKQWAHCYCKLRYLKIKLKCHFKLWYLPYCHLVEFLQKLLFFS